MEKKAKTPRKGTASGEEEKPTPRKGTAKTPRGGGDKEPEAGVPVSPRIRNSEPRKDAGLLRDGKVYIVGMFETSPALFRAISNSRYYSCSF